MKFSIALPAALLATSGALQASIVPAPGFPVSQGPLVDPGVPPSFGSTQDSEILPLDLGGDSTPEFTFTLSWNRSDFLGASNSIAVSFAPTISGGNANGRAYHLNSGAGNFASDLLSGVTLDTTAADYDDNPTQLLYSYDVIANSFDTPAESWITTSGVNSLTAYVGFRFRYTTESDPGLSASSSSFYHGWAEVTLTTDSSTSPTLAVNQVWYEDTLGATIQTGQIPEPSTFSLATFAFCTGLLLRRKRK